MMLNFSLDPQGYWRSPGYRGITLNDWGWDVYALQTGLNKFADPPITEDGLFGPRTLTAVRRFQKNRDLLVDGIAGNATQFTIIRGIAPSITKKHGLPANGIKGAVESESGNYLGNHTANYPDGSWDLGVSQINNLHKGVSFEQAFDVVWALEFFGDTIKKAFVKYSANDSQRADRLESRGLSTTLSAQRRWELAFGSWNRPSHTAWLAGQPKGETQESVPGGKPLTQEQRDWIEGYISRTTVYVNW